MIDFFTPRTTNSLSSCFNNFGWDSLGTLKSKLSVQINNDLLIPIIYKEIAKKFDTYIIYSDIYEIEPNNIYFRKIYNKFKMCYHNVLLFATFHKHKISNDCVESCLTVILWPNSKGGLKNYSFTKKEYDENGLGNILVSKILSLNISGKEITLLEFENLLNGTFNTELVTEKFYKEFKNEQIKISESIVTFSGNSINEDEKRSYSVLLLNRLIFIYFFQKKGFLNSDDNYLRNCLEKVSIIKGKDGFFNFYKNILIPLFFNLNSGKTMELEDWQKEIIGKIPYVNGGLFEEAKVEKQIDFIPDSVFKDVFDLFDGYDWYLDNESNINGNKTINPDVLGHIFEKYINYEADGKKENGAYYTGKDIAYYMINNTLSKKVLSILTDILDIEKINKLLSEDPARYLNFSQKLSMNLNNVSDFINHKSDILWEFGDATSQNNYELIKKEFYSTDYMNIDFDAISKRVDVINCLLPGENMIEALRRHEKVEEYLRCGIYKNLVSNQDLITTYSINIVKLNLDLISLLTFDELKLAYDAVNNISIIDPTCGSGAFLLSAMDILEEYYYGILSELKSRNEKYVIDKIHEYPNIKYFIRKEIALKNIYGTDLMGDAVETAKLRLFLSLVSTIENSAQVRPLPDLDFNLKQGNLVVGITSISMFERIVKNRGVSLFDSQIIDPIKNEIEKYIKFYKYFQDLNINNAEKRILNEKKKELEDLVEILREKINDFYASEFSLGRNDSAKKILEDLKAFHWIIEFPQIFATDLNPGFDIIIGNPPYIKMSEIKKIYSGKKWKLIDKYKTSSCPDFYAVCYENSLALLKVDGYHSFIVMHNITFSKKYDSIRNLILSSGVTYWSSFGLRPAQLFKNAIVRNAIVTLEKKSTNRSYGTQHNLFNAKYRNVLFENLDFFEFTNYKYMKAGIFNKYFDRFNKHESQFCGETTNLYCRNTFSYWYPVLPSKPFVLNKDFSVKGLDANSKTIMGVPMNIKNQVLFLLGGRFGYLFWGVYGDDYNNLPGLVNPFINLLTLKIDEISKNIVISTEDVKYICNNFTSTNLHAGVLTSNIKWTSPEVLSETNKKDIIFLKIILNEEEIADAWRKLNVWFYRAKKSTNIENERLLSSNIVIENKLWRGTD